MRDSGYRGIDHQLKFLRTALAEKCEVGSEFSNFARHLKERWARCRYSQRFIDRNKFWLKGTESFRIINAGRSSAGMFECPSIQSVFNKPSYKDKIMSGHFPEEESIDGVIYDDELEELDEQHVLLDEFHKSYHGRGEMDEETMGADDPACDEPVEVTDDEPNLEVAEHAPSESQKSSKLEPEVAAHHGRSFPARLFYGCNLCGFACLQEADLIKHRVIHQGKQPFSCGQCDYHCREEYELEIHKAMHIAEKLLKCDQCNYRSLNEDDLKKHKGIHTRNSESQPGYLVHDNDLDQCYMTQSKLFACDICVYMCQNSQDMKIHKKVHSKSVQQPSEMLYICDHCDYFCEDEKLLEEHQMSHATGGLHYVWYV